MAAQPLDELGAADDDARLWSAEQLVAREADEVGACSEALRRGRLVSDPTERAGAEVVDERKVVAPSDVGELRETRPLREADDAEVRLMHAQEQGGVGADRRLVVGRARAIRRPDLDEARARARKDVRDAEPVADLDQLAPRDDDLATLPRAQRGRGARQPRCC